MNAYAERALYVLQCAEKERDELLHRMEHSAPNDAIRITGEFQLRGFKDKIAQARRNADQAGVPQAENPQANIAAKETDRILRLPKK